MGKHCKKSLCFAGLLVVILLFVILTAAACGSSEEVTTATAAPATTASSAPTSSSEATATTSAQATETTQAAGPATGTPYKIAILTTLSGDFAFLGKFIADTTALEVDFLNSQGGVDGHPIALVTEDDGLDPAKAAASFKKLAEDSEVLAIFGTQFINLLPALQPLAEQYQVPFITICPSLPETREQNPKWTFIGGADEKLNVDGLINICQMKGYTHPIFLSMNDPMSLAYEKLFAEKAAAAGWKYSFLPDTIDPGTVDVTPVVNKLKELYDNDGGDVVVSAVYPNLLSALRKTMTSVGLELPMIAYSITADASLLSMGGEELNGLMMPGPKVEASVWLPDSDPQKAVITAFVERYKAKFNSQPGQIQAECNDAVNWLALGLKTAGADRAKLRDALASVKDLIGAFAIRTPTAADTSGIQPGVFTPLVIENMQFTGLK